MSLAWLGIGSVDEAEEAKVDRSTPAYLETGSSKPAMRIGPNLATGNVGFALQGRSYAFRTHLALGNIYVMYVVKSPKEGPNNPCPVLGTAS